MSTIRYILVSAICLAMFLGSGYLLVQAFPTLVKANDEAVQDGREVTVHFDITPQDDLTTTYSETTQFIQGQHRIPPGFEQQVAGMHPGERKTFSLSAEEGFGPYDETKLQTIPIEQLPLEAREGDRIIDPAGRTARIVRIQPETAVLDINHPLAGKPLNVTLQIVRIEEETTRP